MASYGRALESVRTQTQRNYATPEGGTKEQVGQVFNVIFDSLAKDLDPENERMGPFGLALDYLIPFKEKQRRAKAEREASIAEMKFTAGANLRSMSDAERLKVNLEGRAAENKQKSILNFEQNRATFDATDSVKDFMFDAVNKSPGLAATFSSFNTENNRHLFKIFNEGDIPGIQAGRLVYTDEATGKKLYATADNDAKNLNYHHAKISTNMAENLKSLNFSIDDIRKSYSSVEGREKLFADDDFKKAIQKTLEDVPNEILVTHKIYQGALNRRMEQINKRLKDRSRIVGANIRKADIAIAQYIKTNSATLFAGGDTSVLDGLKAERELYKIEELKTSLDGEFKEKFQAKVNEKAFILSLLKGQKVDPGRADVNIDQAIRLVMKDDDGSLRRYRKDLEYFYGIGKEKLQNGGEDTSTYIFYESC